MLQMGSTKQGGEKITPAKKNLNSIPSKHAITPYRENLKWKKKY